MTTPEKLPEVARRRPSVAITLSRGALALVDKRAKEAELSRSRIIEGPSLRRGASSRISHPSA